MTDLLDPVPVPAPASKPVPARPREPFEVIVFAVDGDHERDLLYDVQKEFNTGEHGKVSDPAIRRDWNGTPRRFEVIAHSVHPIFSLTFKTNDLEEAAFFRDLAVTRYNALYNARREAVAQAKRTASCVEAKPVSFVDIDADMRMAFARDIPDAMARGAKIYRTEHLGHRRISRVCGVEIREVKGGVPVLVDFRIGGCPDLIPANRRDFELLGKLTDLRDYPVIVDPNHAYAVCLPDSEGGFPRSLFVLLEPVSSGIKAVVGEQTR